jgi:hypothetical protein
MTVNTKRETDQMQRKVLIFLCLMSGCFTAGKGHAAEAAAVPTPAATPASAPAPTPVSQPIPEIRVTKAVNLTHRGIPEHKYHNAAGIGEVVEISVTNLQALLDQAACQNAKGEKISGCTTQDIGLFLEGRLIRGLLPETKVLNGRDGSVQFHLQRGAENDEAWADLLGGPTPGPAFFTRNVSISVGLANGSQVETDMRGHAFKLVRIRPIRFFFCSVLVLILVILIYWKGCKGQLLRDPGPEPKEGKSRPYSLARFQMAFWFILVVGSFLYIWQVTGAGETITTGILALVGIGSATVLGASSIDENKQNEKAAKIDALKAEIPVLTAAVNALADKIKGLPNAADTVPLVVEQADKQKRLILITGELKALTNQPDPPSTEGFLNDVLNDANGISLHRLQMFAWTFVLGLMFVGSVWARLSMPEFSATLLGMQGLSAGTYLGFKISEKSA